MIQVAGIYDGEVVRPLEPIDAEPNTKVEIRFSEPNPTSSNGSTKEEMIERLMQMKIIVNRPTGGPIPHFKPIKIEGPPLSQAIIDERDEMP